VRVRLLDLRHLELTFVAEKPPPAYAFERVALLAGEEGGEVVWSYLAPFQDGPPDHPPAGSRVGSIARN